VARILETQLQKINAGNIERQAEDTRAKLDAQYPGWERTVAGNQFQEWIAADTKRVEMYVQADRGADFDSASSLLKSWNELADEANAGADRVETARAARTESGTPQPRRGKRYSRAKIRLMAQTQPAAYEAELGAIKKAYMEGRVDD